MTQLNTPALWSPSLPKLQRAGHKYTRGYTLVCGGDKTMTGASKLAALAAARSGSGATAIVCSTETLPLYAPSLLSVMTRIANTPAEFRGHLNDDKITALLVGPGTGLGSDTVQKTMHCLESAKPCVVDADALSVFESQPDTLLAALHERCVLTPHSGEFERLFKKTGAKLESTESAATQCKAVIVHKGAETIIAQQGRETVMYNTAPAWLATAGAGDVLAGIIAGLIAQGMPAFEAACAGVWLHGEAATQAGIGMIAEDMLKWIAPIRYQNF